MTLREALARLPGPAHEDWKYTDISGLAQRAFIPATPQRPDLPSLDGIEMLAFANGHHLVGDVGAPPGRDRPAAEPVDSVTTLNAAFATGGMNLDVAAGQARAPLHLVTWFGGTGDGTAHLRHRVRVARNAQAVLVLQELGDDAAFFATQVLDIELADNAQLALYRIQQFGRGTTALTRIDARLGRDSRLALIGMHGGGALVRNDVNVALEAPGAQAELHGVLAPVGAEHLDVHTRLDHRAPHGRSRESFRVIAQDKSRAVFNGKVIVQPGAQKTDSEQHVDSLLLAAGAEVNAKPDLEIYADDVKCAHGATVGQLDEQAIHYLRTRGIDQAAARNLLLFTFAHVVLKDIALAPARVAAEAALVARLPGGAALTELL